ncbi:MAG: S-adenosylmethionine:tRNA ribosyltransferase-isomerase [Bacteroidetes bacterium]|nr:MAG: S-adenosylmethionine:tRNA ribosyltransferase-isomerase [Bacteroidota bacterium]
MNPKEINIKDYSYELPEEKIAKFPLEKRDESKLLHYQAGEISETTFKFIDESIPANSLVVFNNTKVIHARVLFQRETGAQIEVFCIEPLEYLDYQLAFASKGNCAWKCIIGNAKRWKEDVLQKFVNTPSGIVQLKAEKKGKAGELFLVEFSWDNKDLFFAEVLHYAGILPLPPYLNRDTELSDEERYQTIYAKQQGSVAAPTAGLHFTEDVFNKLAQKNIKTAEVTLHVGAGTFKPVKSTELANHEMHEETIFVERSTIENILQTLTNKHPLIAVGTTSMRTLESLYWWGVRLLTFKNAENVFVAQWDAYELDASGISADKALQAILHDMDAKKESVLQGSTQIIIAPGYEFKLVDAIITNFHQPENTLILLIAAFVGPDWRKIYEYALANNYRFLSYGDSSLLWKNINVLM